MSCCFKVFNRRLSTYKKSVSDFPWLSQPYVSSNTQSSLPSRDSTSQSQISSGAHVTTLTNGLRVGSHASAGEFCTVGVAVNAGSRYEMFSPSGVTHFLEKLAYNSTRSFQSKDHVLKELEALGGVCDCQYSRDVAFYAMSVNKQNLKAALDILSEVVLHPSLQEEEIELARLLVNYDLEDHAESLIRMQPDILLHDLVHRASFRGNTIGLPKFCPSENIQCG